MEPSAGADVEDSPPHDVALPLTGEALPLAGDQLTLVLSLALPLLLALLFLLSRRRGARGAKVLLLGPSHSGKTAIFLQLHTGRASPTVTSMQPASAAVALKPPGAASAAKSVQLVDAPGSGRLRGQLMAALPAASALVCVIDGTCLASHAREAAQLLYDVLTHEAIERAPPPLLVAVNKSELPGAASPAAARKQLEAEVSRVRLARTTMQDTSERARQLRGIAAGDAGAPFSFEQLDSPVEFVACSAVKSELDALIQFIFRHAR
ncbi:hypothetical protein AB1Y20_021037 [Prymnesium parvum]|uniref:Signal recognition particle receptor subunit beta n=1 Tax=Prymnesium parvum TaxID=97485 RepID=A0AB34JKW9_PRYPA